MAEKDKDKDISVTVVVSGQSVTVATKVNQKVSHLVTEALRLSGNSGRPGDSWELKFESGVLIDQAAKIGEAGIADGMTLFLSPAAGGGG